MPTSGLYSIEAPCYISENPDQPLGSDILEEFIRLQPGINRKQEALVAGVLMVSKKRDVVADAPEHDDRIRVGVLDIVDQHRIMGGVGRNTLVTDDLQDRIFGLDERADGVGLRAGESLVA